MQSRMREVRKARRLTLAEVAKRCVPPTTAQTIGRLETGVRTLSIDWLNRIADALDVDPSELVTLPDRADLPLTARLTGEGAEAFDKPNVAPVPLPADSSIAVRVDIAMGDYRGGDLIWLDRLEPEDFPRALNRDILAPRRTGRFGFGRLIDLQEDRLLILPPQAGAKQLIVERPPWIAVASRLIRAL